VVVFELAIILIWSLIRLWKLVRKKLTPDATLQTRIMFDAYNVVALLLAGMLFYLVDGFSRIFIPPLLMIVLLQIAQKDYKPVSMILMLNVLFASSFLDYHGVNYYGNFDSVQTNYTSEIPQISRLQRELETYVVFDRETTNPWCNTLLIPLDYYDYRVTIVPPGIGISYIYLTPPNKAHLKSNYLLLDKTTYETLLSNENINAELLTSLSIGDLYHNLDSGCDIKFDF
jgi:general stress protein CsbA